MPDVSHDGLIYQDLSYQIIGVLFDVFNELGSGLKERAYERAIAAGFNNRKVSFKEQAYHPLSFENQVIASYYFDFIIENKVVLELKVGEHFSRKNIDQIYKYLVAKNYKLGLLANFTRTGVKIKRIVNIQ